MQACPPGGQRVQYVIDEHTTEWAALAVGDHDGATSIRQDGVDNLVDAVTGMPI